jgi:hypothetical protein
MSAINPSRNMPAASVIKIPVMVEVFRQMALGRLISIARSRSCPAIAIGAGAIWRARRPARATRSRDCSR